MARGNVLVVDDDERILQLLMAYLRERSSLDVDGARDGVEALHLVFTRPYAVVLLDVMMPHMSGIDFLDSLEAVRTDPSIHTLVTPPAVLVITGAPQEMLSADDLQHRFPTLVHGVLRKPMDIGALAMRVETLMA